MVDWRWTVAVMKKFALAVVHKLVWTVVSTDCSRESNECSIHSDNEDESETLSFCYFKIDIATCLQHTPTSLPVL